MRKETFLFSLKVEKKLGSQSFPTHACLFRNCNYFAPSQAQNSYVLQKQSANQFLSACFPSRIPAPLPFKNWGWLSWLGTDPSNFEGWGGLLHKVRMLLPWDPEARGGGIITLTPCVLRYVDFCNLQDARRPCSDQKSSVFCCCCDLQVLCFPHFSVFIFFGLFPTWWCLRGARRRRRRRDPARNPPFSELRKKTCT